MRWIVTACAIVLAGSLLAGCRVCLGACAKEQGRAVTGVVPQPDGTIQITTCTLTTKGTSGRGDACRAHVIPAPAPR